MSLVFNRFNFTSWKKEVTVQLNDCLFVFFIIHEAQPLRLHWSRMLKAYLAFFSFYLLYLQLRAVGPTGVHTANVVARVGREARKQDIARAPARMLIMHTAALHVEDTPNKLGNVGVTFLAEKVILVLSLLINRWMIQGRSNYQWLRERPRVFPNVLGPCMLMSLFFVSKGKTTKNFPLLQGTAVYGSYL